MLVTQIKIILYIVLNNITLHNNTVTNNTVTNNTVTNNTVTNNTAILVISLISKLSEEYSKFSE